MEIKKEVFKTEEGFGYKILVDRKALIIQNYKPAISGNQTMAESEANGIADLVVSKMITGNSPTLSAEEVNSIK